MMQVKDERGVNIQGIDSPAHYLSICYSINSFIHADLQILGFEQDTYQVSEANNSVVVCVNITDRLERSVVVNLQTMDGTAQG